MNYELAKKLEDAGFPQPESLTEGDLVLSATANHENEEYEPLHYPTLEELIEACGDEFEMLEKDGYNANLDEEIKGWMALAKNHATIGSSSTPSEAVANLWLALNKKD